MTRMLACAVLFVIGSALVCAQESAEAVITSVQTKKIGSVQKVQVEVSIDNRSIDSLSIPIQVDTKANLNAICTRLERFDGKQWQEAPAADHIVIGDRPVRFDKLPNGQSARFLFEFFPFYYKLAPDSELRLSIRADCRPERAVNSTSFRLPDKTVLVRGES